MASETHPVQKRKRSESETTGPHTTKQPSAEATRAPAEQPTQCRSGNAKPVRNSIQWQQLTGKGGRTLIVAVSHPADSPHPVRKRLAGHRSAAATSRGRRGRTSVAAEPWAPGTQPDRRRAPVAAIRSANERICFDLSYICPATFCRKQKKAVAVPVANTDLAIFLCSEGKK